MDNLPLQRKSELYIGGIFPITGTKYRAPQLVKVAQMAVEDVNLNQNVLPGFKLVLSVSDGKCEADVVMKRFIDIIKTKDTSRFHSTVGMLGNYDSVPCPRILYCYTQAPHVQIQWSPLPGCPNTSALW